MTQHCTPAEKQHMTDLTREIRDYLANIQEQYKKPVSERIDTINRMKAIRKEMQEFRRKYPDD